MEKTEWISTGQAARLAGCSQHWIRVLAKNGKLECIASGLGFLVRRSEVEQLARQRALNPSHQAIRSTIA